MLCNEIKYLCRTKHCENEMFSQQVRDRGLQTSAEDLPGEMTQSELHSEEVGAAQQPSQQLHQTSAPSREPFLAFS